MESHSHKPGQIVIVNGTSGSGKSTACELFQREADDYWLLYGIDHFMANTLPAKFGHHGPRGAEGVEAVPAHPDKPDGPLKWQFAENARRAFAVMHEWVAVTARMGANIIFDHLLLQDPPVLADLARRLEGLPVLLVTLKPPLEVLEKRVAQRAMTKRVPTEILGEDAARVIVKRLDRLRPWFFEEVYRNTVSDLVIDTSQHSPEEVCAQIRARLAQGPGTAMATLRKMHPEGGFQVH